MEPYNFEENIREKFEARELKPSKNAWEKLDAKLDSPISKSNKTFNWLAVAAGFVGILLLATFFFGKDKSIIDVTENSVVQQTTNAQTVQKLNSDPAIDEKLISKEISTSEVTIEAEVVTDNTAKPTNKNSTLIAENSRETNEVKTEKLKGTNEQIETTVLNSNQILNTKISEVVANIELLKAKNSNVTIAEIDALLEKAQREIRADRIFNSIDNKVDATALLEDAEWMAERSFREKVFLALGQGYEKVRTAIVERNQ